MEKLRHQPEVIAESRLRSWRDPERFVDGYTSTQIRTASWTRLGGCAMGRARAARAAPREPAGRARDLGERARRPRLGPARARLPRALRRRALVRRALRGRAGRDAGRLRARRPARAVARALACRCRAPLPRRRHAPLALLARVDAGPLRLPALRVGRGAAGRADGARLPRARCLQHAERDVLHGVLVASPARAAGAPPPPRLRR